MTFLLFSYPQDLTRNSGVTSLFSRLRAAIFQTRSPLVPRFVLSLTALCGGFLLAVTAIPVLAQAEDHQPPAAPATSVAIPDLMAQGQNLYDKREQPGNIDLAVASYKKVLESNPDHFEALWKLAMCYHWIGSEGQGDSRLDAFRQGKDFAEKAMKVSPGSFEGYFWFAVCLGYVCSEQKSFSSLGEISRVIQALETTLRLKPNFGIAQHVLAMLYLNAPGWPLSCGDVHKSLQYAEQAVANQPDMVLTHWGLASVLLAMGKKQEAKDRLEFALALPGPSDHQPETAREKDRARELLSKIQ